VLVGGNQNFYFEKGDPKRYLAPDVYIIPDEATPLEEVKTWKLWEHNGKGPVLAIEVVSDEYDKDYSPETLNSYERLGVQELIRYDPLHRMHPRATKFGPRQLLTHFVRDTQGG
jgi:Uma2 family endonuclease